MQLSALQILLRRVQIFNMQIISETPSDNLFLKHLMTKMRWRILTAWNVYWKGLFNIAWTQFSVLNLT